MLILMLSYVHYLQNNFFSFEKSSNGQIHSSGSHHPDKKISQAKFPFPCIPYCYFENPVAHQILKSALSSLHLLVILHWYFLSIKFIKCNFR